MTLNELKTQFGIKSIVFNQYKESGSFMATVINPTNNASIQLFTTKATGLNFDLNSPITMIDGKFYIGTVKAPIATKTL